MNKNELVRANVLTIEQMEERVEAAATVKFETTAYNRNGDWGVEAKASVSFEVC